MKKAHFLAFMQHGVSSHSVGMWRHPLDKIGYDYAAPLYWEHLARTLERGLFDVIPELQRRGAYKTSYTEGTLRHKLFGQGPRLPETHRAARYRRVTQEVTR